MNTASEHPTTTALKELLALVEALPMPEMTEAEKDRAKTRALRIKAQRRNARRITR